MKRSLMMKKAITLRERSLFEFHPGLLIDAYEDSPSRAPSVKKDALRPGDVRHSVVNQALRHHPGPLRPAYNSVYAPGRSSSSRNLWRIGIGRHGDRTSITLPGRVTTLVNQSELVAR
jgi:hypothetical protein